MPNSTQLRPSAKLELRRRRQILERHIGDSVSVKRALRQKRGLHEPVIGLLTDVKRTRVLLQFTEPIEDSNWLVKAEQPKPIFGAVGRACCARAVSPPTVAATAPIEVRAVAPISRPRRLTSDFFLSISPGTSSLCESLLMCRSIGDRSCDEKVCL